MGVSETQPHHPGCEGLQLFAVSDTDRSAANVLPIILKIRRAGATSLHQIADALNARGISTPRGGKWYTKSVSNALERA